MVYSRFVEVGRLVLVNYGRFSGQLAVITNVVDDKSVVIDCSGETGSLLPRQQISLSRISLTQFKVPIGLNARRSTITKAFASGGVVKKFQNSPRGRYLARREKRAALTDFEKFQVRLAKKQRAIAVRKEYQKLRKASK